MSPTLRPARHPYVLTAALFGFAVAPQLAHAQPPAVAPEGPRERIDGDPVAQALSPQPGGLSAAQAAREAVATAPTVDAAQADLQAAAAIVDQTWIRYLPRLAGEASYTRISSITADVSGGAALVGAGAPGPLGVGACPDGSGTQCVVDSAGDPVGAQAASFDVPLNQWSLTASLGVPLSDLVISLIPARKSAIAARESAKIRAKAEARKASVDAEIAYYNWLKSRAATAVARASLTRVKARLVDAHAQYRAGTASKADVMRLKAQVASTKSGLASTEAMERVAARNVAVLMGREGPARFEVGEDVLQLPGPEPGVGDLEGLIAEARRNRPALRSVERQVIATQQGVRATRADYYPKLTGFGEATYANPNQRFFPLQQEWNGNWAVGLALTWSPNQIAETGARVRELKARERSANAQLVALRRGVTMEVTSAHEELVRSRRAAALAKEAVEAAAEGYRVAADLYREGSATTTDLISAEFEQVNASLADVNARIDVRIAQSRLRYATGRNLPGLDSGQGGES